MQWGAKLFQRLPYSSLKEWQKATAVAQKVVANQMPLWAGQGKTEKPDTDHGGQEQWEGMRNRRWSWSKDFLLWEIQVSRTAFQGRRKGKLQPKSRCGAKGFWGSTTKHHFLFQQTGLEDTRPSSKSVQLRHVVWRPCTTRCSYFRQVAKKPHHLSFHFYPTSALLSSSCISPRTVTIEELKLLHTTDQRQWIITIISSD